MIPVSILVAIQILLLSGCAWNEYDRFQAAEAALERCLEEHPNEPQVCDSLRATRDQEYERYEAAAERSWGCENTPDRCRDVP